MAFSDILVFENPEVLAFAAAVLVFIISFTAINKFIREKGAALLISVAISAIVGWKLYRERFYGWEISLALIFGLIALAIFGKILWAFIRNIRRRH